MTATAKDSVIACEPVFVPVDQLMDETQVVPEEEATKPKAKKRKLG
jgi:hypothetical protein